MNLQRLLASSFSAFTVTVLAISIVSSNAYANEDLIVREPAQKKSVPASDDKSPSYSSNSGGSNGDFTNLRVAALGLLVRAINLDLEFRLGDNWSVGPTVTYWNFDFETTGYVGNKLKSVYKAFGARANWAQNGTYRNGMYLSPMLQFVTANVEGVSSSSGATITSTASAPVLTGLIGYQWFGDGGFNVNVGAGLAVGTGSTKAEATDGTTTVRVESSRTGAFAIDFMVGYVF